jgi:ATP-dependent DNA helicase RecQ
MNAFNDSVIISRLRETFGYENFRDQQNKIIENILNGYNTLVMMSTGSGKSLCYQMPAIIHDGMAIVVSPLISLMKNQVDYLQSLEIRAEIINSSVKRKDLESIKDDISNNKIKLLY